MNIIDHPAAMAKQDHAFPDYDQRGWPVPIVGAILNVHEDCARLTDLANALRSTNALRAEQVHQIACSLRFGADPADRYMDKTTGPGLAAAAPAWTSVGDRLPEERAKPYQVFAICLKTYGLTTCYPGEGKRTVCQDWAIRRWPENFTHWCDMPPLPVDGVPG